MFDIIYTYFNQNKCLDEYIIHWNSFSLETKKLFNIIIVDDYSTKSKAVDIINKHKITFNLQLFYISTDKGYNIAGACNLGAMKARSNKIIRLDFDQQIQEKAINQINILPVTTSNVYMVRKNDKKLYSSVLIFAKALWDNGFIWDEDFSPFYGWEDHYYIKVLQHYNINIDNIPLDLIANKGGITLNLDRKSMCLHSRKIYLEKLKQIKKPTNPIRFSYNMEYSNYL